MTIHLREEGSMYSCDRKTKETLLAPFEVIEVKTQTIKQEYGIDVEDDQPFTSYFYDLKYLVKRTKDLMEHMHIPYASHVVDEEGNTDSLFVPYKDMSEQDRHFWYPFGFILACLDGNAFASIDEPQYDLVEQYAAEARLVVYHNRMNVKDEYRETLNQTRGEERKNAFFVDDNKVKAELVRYMKRAIATLENNDG